MWLAIVCQERSRVGRFDDHLGLIVGISLPQLHVAVYVVDLNEWRGFKGGDCTPPLFSPAA